MESQGEPDRIQISEATYRLIRDDFETTLRGPIEVKGLGTLTTWYLEPTPEPQQQRPCNEARRCPSMPSSLPISAHMR